MYKWDNEDLQKKAQLHPKLLINIKNGQRFIVMKKEKVQI